MEMLGNQLEGLCEIRGTSFVKVLRDKVGNPLEKMKQMPYAPRGPMTLGTSDNNPCSFDVVTLRWA